MRACVRMFCACCCSLRGGVRSSADSDHNGVLDRDEAVFALTDGLQLPLPLASSLVDQHAAQLQAKQQQQQSDTKAPAATTTTTTKTPVVALSFTDFMSLV